MNKKQTKKLVDDMQKALQGVQVEVAPKGIQQPAHGDALVVDIYIQLPTDGDIRLHSALKFDSRVFLCGHRLYEFVGELSEDKKYRVVHGTIVSSAKTWYLAMEEAKQAAYTELDKLKKKVEYRINLLVGAILT